jgi:CMP-N,N'-diacetyllegionaminic acid synthase
MKLLALVPARGGSKRLPGKNIKPLAGKPLIQWTIQPALESQLFCDVILSTDDEQIAETGKSLSCLVPWLRPASLSSDTATSIDVALHALDWYEAEYGKVDGLVLLQPTSPFRSINTLHETAKLFASDMTKPVVTVSPVQQHPAWCFYQDESGIAPCLGWEESNKRSQDLKPAYVLNGVVYITPPEVIRKENNFINNSTRAHIVINTDEIIDIDTEDDWNAAQRIAFAL